MTDSQQPVQHRTGKRRKPIRITGQQVRSWTLFGLVGLALVVIVVFLNVRSNQRKQKLRNNNSLAEFENAETGFDQTLARGNIDQLIVMSNELVDEPGEPVITRLDRIRKRIAISDRIMALGPDDNARNLAIATKLKQLMDREWVIAEQQMYSDASSLELKEYAERQAESTEISVSNLARTAIAIAAISDFLNAGASANRAELANEAIERFNNAAESATDDPGTATRLYDWLQILKDQSRQEESRLFFDAWSTAYANASDSRIAKLADQIDNASSLSEVELIDISNSVRSDRDLVVRQLLEQIDNTLSHAEVSDATVLFALQRATELLAFGRAEDALHIRQAIEQSSAGRNSDKISNALAVFERRLKMFESALDASSFKDLKSEPVRFNIPDAEFRILYFVTDVNNGVTVPQFTKLIETVRSELLNSKLEIVVAYMDRGDDPIGLGQIREFAAQNGRWQVWFLETNSPEGQEFLARIPIDKSPYVIVLGKDDRPIALDPSIYRIEEIVFAN